MTEIRYVEVARITESNESIYRASCERCDWFRGDEDADLHSAAGFAASHAIRTGHAVTISRREIA